MTRSWLIGERLLMMLSVSPSLRYSVCGSRLMFLKGNTASARIAWLLFERDLYSRKPPMAAATINRAAIGIHLFERLATAIPLARGTVAGYGVLDPDESRSRFKF